MLYITLVAFVLALIFVITGLVRGDYWPELIVIVIGIVVGTGGWVLGRGGRVGYDVQLCALLQMPYN